MSFDGEGPPWFAKRPDGVIQYGAVPDRLLHNRELRNRGIVLDHALKPGTVFVTFNPLTSEFMEPEYVVKVLDLNTEELPIYERLLRDIHSSANHTVPSEILHSDHPILLMPLLDHISTYLRDLAPGKPLCPLLQAFHELIEGVEYLHRQHIAHLDLCIGNVAVAYRQRATSYKGVTPNRVYIIDYDTAKQFALGPGHQRAIILPDTQITPPNESRVFDPYSWDIYCLGRLFELMLQSYYSGHRRPSRVAQWFVTWLVGEEQGCTGACRCRPTARTSLRVLKVIGWVAPIFDLIDKVM
ncbi:hypothetical protein OH77DRAFT_1318258 [Trametes cingulata]|nr:hypothetical protein OH77DRAFT_1318258 [Trametes cingulata]